MLFTVVESITFVSFLYIQIKNKNVKVAALFIGVALVLFNILYPLFINNVKQIDSVPIGVETIIIIIISFYYLYEKTNDTATLYIYSTFPFWIVIGMVIYLSGSFFIYIFAESLSIADLHKYWFVTNILSILKNIFFTIGIIVNSKPPKKLPPSDFEFSALN